MQQIKISKNRFDFDAFAKKVLKFLKGEVSEVDPSYAIVKVTAPGCVPEYGPEKGRSNFIQELEAGHLLFFPFSSSNVGEPVSCVDGKSRQIEDDSDFALGDVDCVGFLIQLTGQDFIINSAMHAGGACPGPSPSVDVSDCDIFDAGMHSFVKKFIRT